MVPSIQRGRMRVKGGIRILGMCLLPVTMGLSACSSVPDAINPVSWYQWAIGSDDDESDVADDDMPAAGGVSESRGSRSADKSARAAPADGLVADSQGTEYASPIRRDIAPTKPLVRHAPVLTDAMVASSAKSDQPAQGLGAPPATKPNMTPPGSPNIPDMVAMQGKGASGVLDNYHRRLQESAANTFHPPTTGGLMPAGASDAAWNGAVHLVPPKGGKIKPDTSTDGSNASFQLAALDLRSGGGQLTPSDTESLREVVRLYRQYGGVVRVVGLSSGSTRASRTLVISSSSVEGYTSPASRADAVARELVKMGVPRNKVLVGAVAPGTPPAADGVSARVYLDL